MALGNEECMCGVWRKFGTLRRRRVGHHLAPSLKPPKKVQPLGEGLPRILLADSLNEETLDSPRR